ncbi:MAG: tRNA (adenosine(37)-N6)-dimethylallyltransferase MiaA [Chloroflexi bacterium]|nr:tRNA (adenosine(37)-N6)-dimethylallyltransferase MiaA [Chloroflexota bacterium]
MARLRLIVIVGPTAVGKTAFAVGLARRFDGEIVGADSRQIYRSMEAQYKEMAGAAIADIAARGRLPFLVGGTGLYLKAVLEGWTIPRVAPDPRLRARLEAEAQAHGGAHLHARLQQVDSLAAQKIDPHNTRRVIRALEVYETTGQPISARQGKNPPAYDTLQLGLTMPRSQLYRRIDQRVDAMMESGLVDEVRALLAHGYDDRLPAMSGFGYQQIAKALRGEITLTDAVTQFKTETRRFVRRQYAWFPLDNSDILWLDAGDGAFERACAAIEAFLAAVHNP